MPPKYPQFSKYLYCYDANVQEISRDLGYICKLIEEEVVDSNTVKEFLLQKCDSGAAFINSFSVGTCL